MYSKTSLLLAFALTLCLFETALSLKCYSCMSTIDGDCYKNPKGHTVDCDLDPSKSTSPDPKSITIYNAINNQLKSMGIADIDINFECGTYMGIHVPSNTTGIIRTCTHKIVPCDAMKLLLSTTTDIKVDTCNNCNTDLCNSSNNATAGIFILGFSLLLTMLFSDKL